MPASRCCSLRDKGGWRALALTLRAGSNYPIQVEIEIHFQNGGLILALFGALF